MNSLTELGKRAKIAAQTLACAPSAVKDAALREIARSLRAELARILAANEQDLLAAKQAGISASMQDRLTLDEARVGKIADAVCDIAATQDPVGRILGGQTRPNGLRIEQVTTPMGVIGMIFEARPNVTVDAAVLCLKSSNACILRGGKEAIHSNSALAALMREALERSGLPADCILLIEDVSRQSATDLMTLNGYLDLLIPRGGKGLIQSVVQNASVPTIETGAGNCHIYVDAGADPTSAVAICDNAKSQRPSVCNAVETVLVHRDIAPAFLPLLKATLDKSAVELRGCPRTAALLPGITAATEQDWETEFNDYILAIRVVDTLDDAITHITRYSTGHSEAILTNDYANAQQFTARVDSAAVYVNASTRFTDGGEFGLGAEIGISTQKLHARGPMGLSALCSHKFIVTGCGQIR